MKLLDLNSLESIIFTQIKARFSKKIKSKYKDLKFTTEEESKETKPLKFPNVYIYLMPSAETGLTLERTAIEGGLFTFQIKVTDNQALDSERKSRVKVVMTEIVRVMKTMSFEIISIPAYDNTKDTYWSTARFRRQLDRDDFL